MTAVSMVLSSSSAETLANYDEDLRSLVFVEASTASSSRSVAIDSAAWSTVLPDAEIEDSLPLQSDAATDSLLQANLAGRLSVAQWHEWVKHYPTDTQAKMLEGAAAVLPTDTAVLFALSNVRKEQWAELNSVVPHALGSAEDIKLRRARQRWLASLRKLEACEEGNSSPSVRQNLGAVLQMEMLHEESELHFTKALELMGLSVATGQVRRALTEAERRDVQLALAGLDSVLAHQSKVREAGHRLGVNLGYWARLDQRPPTYTPGLIGCPFHDSGGYTRLIAPLERAAPAMRREMLRLLRQRANGNEEEAAQWYVDNENIAERPEHWLRRHIACHKARPNTNLDAPKTCRAVQRAMRWYYGAAAPDATDTPVPRFYLKAQFSILAPDAHLVAHCGPTNERLAISVGLAGVGDAEIRVGATWRRWSVGEAILFDDSFEHEVRNWGSDPRAVMIIHIVTPQLMPPGTNGASLVANMSQNCLTFS